MLFFFLRPCRGGRATVRGRRVRTRWLHHCSHLLRWISLWPLRSLRDLHGQEVARAPVSIEGSMYCRVEATFGTPPTGLNNDVLNDGVILEMYNRVNNMAIGTSFKFLFTKIRTPRYFFLKAQRLILVLLYSLHRSIRPVPHVSIQVCTWPCCARCFRFS